MYLGTAIMENSMAVSKKIKVECAQPIWVINLKQWDYLKEISVFSCLLQHYHNREEIKIIPVTDNWETDKENAICVCVCVCNIVI